MNTSLNSTIKLTRTASVAVISTLLLSACANFDRLNYIGEAPPIEQTSIEKQADALGYKQISLPMPTPRAEIRQANSLWSSGRQAFFENQRAKQIGDIVTVMIDINDQAELTNETTKSRASSEDVDVNNLLGLETYATKVLPKAVDPANLANFGTTSSHKGDGEIKREEAIKLKVAALVSEILPNGNMVVIGRQEVRVNYEKRILEIAGVIRPEDITVSNTISYEQIAEARISYGGQGQITDLQQARYGQQLYDILMPF